MVSSVQVIQGPTEFREVWSEHHHYIFQVYGRSQDEIDRKETENLVQRRVDNESRVMDPRDPLDPWTVCANHRKRKRQGEKVL